jgi:hypothetical protein
MLCREIKGEGEEKVTVCLTSLCFEDLLVDMLLFHCRGFAFDMSPPDEVTMVLPHPAAQEQRRLSFPSFSSMYAQLISAPLPKNATPLLSLLIGLLRHAVVRPHARCMISSPSSLTRSSY